MTTSDLILERAGGILRVTFNRPKSLNALTAAMMSEAARAIEAAGDDPALRSVLITGAGRAFSAGADLTASASGTETLDAANRLTRAIRAVPRPVLAAINGPAVGVGCSFAIAADLSIASESAYLLLAFVNIGLMPDGGATALLSSAIGRVRATRMAMLGERISASQAAEWGLITRAVPHEQFDSEVEWVSSQLAAGPTQAHARVKQAVNALALPGLERALSLEQEGQSALLSSSDFAEGVAAFAQKRLPAFRGQ